MLKEILFYLNLCVIEDFLEKIYLKNVYYVKKNNEIKYINNECIVLKELRDKLINEHIKLIKR